MFDIKKGSDKQVVMLPEEVLLDVMKSKNFITQSRNLANTLNYEHDRDAEQDLLHQFLLVRCKNMTTDEFIEYWNDTSTYQNGVKNRKYLSWLMTYSVKDIVRERQRDTLKKDDMNSFIKQTIKDDIDNKNNTESFIEENQTTQKDKLKELVLVNLKQLFGRSEGKRKVIEHLFESGELETNEFLKHRSKTTLSRWIALIDDYCDKNRNKFDKILQAELLKDDTKILNFINTFLMIENQDGVTLFNKQGQQAQLIDNNKDIMEELIGLCGSKHTDYIHHPKALLNHWERIEYQDEKYNMIQYLEMKKQELESMIKNEV